MDNSAGATPLAAVLPEGELDRLLFVPALGLAALVIVLCALVCFRVPLHDAVMPVEGLLIAMILAAGWRWHRSRSVRPLVGLGLLAAAAAWLALADYAGAWLPTGADVVGLHPDSWSYQAFADYLDHYHRGRSDGMPMVDEFGAHLQGTRFAAPSMLAFLHDQPLFSDVPTSRLVFGSLCLGVHFFSMLALGRVCVGYAGWLMPLLAAFLSTAEGWFSRMLTVANNDNLIFAALTPALIALACLPRAEGAPAVRWQTVLATALVFAAMFYNYPEGMTLLGVLCLPLLIVLGMRGRWQEVGAGVLVGFALTLPYLPTFSAFLRVQIASGLAAGSGPRPGEGIMPGLIGPNRLAGAFALGDELLATSARPVSNLLPLCLLVLMVLGAWFIARRQRWFPWVALPLIGLCLWQNVAKHYDYGTFKVLVMAGWWVALAIAAGLCWCMERGALSAGWRVALAAALLLSVGAVKHANRLRLPPLALADRFRALQELSSVRFVTGQNPVLLALDDDFDYLWATYYLRGSPLGTWRLKGYLAMPHVASLLARGIRPPPEACPFQLVSGSRLDALWQNTRFSLVRTPGVYLEDLQNPVNGLETVGGRRFLWIGTQPATFRVFAARAGRYELSAARFDFGPSMNGHASVHVAVADSDGTRTEEIAPGASAIPLTLAAGDNTIVVRCLDAPEPGPHKGDPRELMLGILAPDVTAAPNAAPGQ